MSDFGTGAFPRIDPNHPLTVAARDVNAYAEEHGLATAVEWLGMSVGTGELAYLCEQRALRAVAAASGVNLSGAPQDQLTARAITHTPLWRDMRPLLIGSYMDGIAIGWRAREIALRETTT